MINIAHIINPVIVDEASDLYAAQPVTFESMRLAKAYSEGSVDVELYSAQYSEDVRLVPDWINRTRNLERSVLNVGSFKKQRKLPLIKDILDRLYESSTADYIIYTNVDISLMPHFYVAVARLIETGLDAMVVNRRTIPKSPSDPSQIELMWAQVGEKHPGYDCFVFHRDAYPLYNLGTAIIGANWIGRVLLANVHGFAKNFKIFEDLHLTFHLGDDRSWKIPEHLDYDEHNLTELLNILEILRGQGKFEGRPILEDMLQDMRRHQRTLEEGPTKKKARPWWKIRGNR